MDNKLTIRRRYIESEDREEYSEIPPINNLSPDFREITTGDILYVVHIDYIHEINQKYYQAFFVTKTKGIERIRSSLFEFMEWDSYVLPDEMLTSASRIVGDKKCVVTASEIVSDVLSASPVMNKDISELLKYLSGGMKKSAEGIDASEMNEADLAMIKVSKSLKTETDPLSLVCMKLLVKLYWTTDDIIGLSEVFLYAKIVSGDPERFNYYAANYIRSRIPLRMLLDMYYNK